MRYDLFYERPHAGEVWEPPPALLDRVDDADRRVRRSARPSREPLGLRRRLVLGQHGRRHRRRPRGALRPGQGEARRYPAHGPAARAPGPRPGRPGATPATSRCTTTCCSRRTENGLKLIVAPAVNNEWLCSLLAYVRLKKPAFECQDMESAKYQIAKMKAFDEAHDWYEIVDEPVGGAHGDRERAPRGRAERGGLQRPARVRRQLDPPARRALRHGRAQHLPRPTRPTAASPAPPTTTPRTSPLPNKLTAWFSKNIEYASEHKSGSNATRSA